MAADTQHLLKGIYVNYIRVLPEQVLIGISFAINKNPPFDQNDLLSLLVKQLLSFRAISCAAFVTPRILVSSGCAVRDPIGGHAQSMRMSWRTVPQPRITPGSGYELVKVQFNHFIVVLHSKHEQTMLISPKTQNVFTFYFGIIRTLCFIPALIKRSIRM